MNNSDLDESDSIGAITLPQKWQNNYLVTTSTETKYERTFFSVRDPSYEDILAAEAAQKNLAQMHVWDEVF